MNRENQKLPTILKVIIVLTLLMFATFIVGAVLISISLPTIIEQKYLKIYEINDTKSFDGINNIDINAVSADMTFYESDSESARVFFHGTASGNDAMNLPELITKAEGGTLKIEIKYPKDTFHFGMITEELFLDIYLPKGFNGSISVNTVSGNLEIKDKNTESFKYTSVSGDLKASGIMSSEFSVNTVSGDQFILGITGDTSIESVSGDIMLEETTLKKDININTVSGDTIIIIPEDSNFNLEYKTISGDFQNSAFTDLKETKAPGEKSVRGKIGNGANKIKVTTVSGDLELR